MKAPRLPRPTEMAHEFLRDRLSPGDHVIDATAGNGHDTLFLAQCVGEEGSVIAFDVQEQAIEQTLRRTAGLPQVALHCIGHENLDKYVKSPIAGAVFNLGYLPSGDKTIVTQPDSTVTALNGALNLLKPSGIITIAVYTGHPGGSEEGSAIEQWAGALEQDLFSVARYSFINQRNTPPFLLLVERR